MRSSPGSCFRVSPGRSGKILALALCACVILLANQRNAETYFDRYARAYIGPSFPHSEAGAVLRGFIESDGAPGNAFSVGFPYWWDYRALGIVAGYPLWPNDGAPIEWLPQKLSDADAAETMNCSLEPERDLLFFINVQDQESLGELRALFPDGRQMLVQSYHPEDQFILYRVPRSGGSGLGGVLCSALSSGRMCSVCRQNCPAETRHWQHAPVSNALATHRQESLR